MNLFKTLPRLFLLSTLVGVCVPSLIAQQKAFSPVTNEMLLNPDPADWLMPSRTYDWQRFSPLKQIDKSNVAKLRMAWSRGMTPGLQENIPLVHQGLMYIASPGGIIQALDATNGDLIWEYRRKLPDDFQSIFGSAGRTRNLAIFEDQIFYTTPDGFMAALDANTGKLNWETLVYDYHIRAQQTSGPIVVQGKVISGRACPSAEIGRQGCFLTAHEPRTGKELWRFYATPGAGEAGEESWGGVPVDQRMASFWGLPGSYDPARKLLYWGIANPAPYTRMKRHGGNVDAISRSAPADLYSNSTIALDPDTGKLAWYYQYLPGDDWDSDFAHDRILFRTELDPDPNSVKWIASKLPRGQERDVAVTVGEPGGIWMIDRSNGGFLWATPFPFDSPDFIVSKVDPETGKTFINWDSVFKKDGERHTICYANTRSYWPLAYHPGQNALYIPYADLCVDMTSDSKDRQGAGRRETIPRPGADPSKLGGFAKVNMSTGKVEWRYTQYAPGYGAMLTTAGDLLFWGDMDRRFRAFDAASGKVLWETILGGAIQTSTITYAVNGKQYVAVLTGEGQVTLTRQFPNVKSPRQHNEIYVFALP